MDVIELKIIKIDDRFADIKYPEYATENSSGLDIRAAVIDEVLLKAGKVALIPTNLRVEIPVGYEIQVRPRSGLAAKHSIGILNSPGTIDADYRGEIKVIMFNFGENDFVIRRGDRIAQLVLAKVYKANLIAVDRLGDTVRGEGGFGHTGQE